MPDTASMSAKLREEGEKGRRAFNEGFGSGGGAEELGASFADKFASSFGSRLRGANLGLGVSGLVEQFDKQFGAVDEKLAAKLKSQLPDAYKVVTAAQEEYTAALLRAQPRQQEQADLIDRIATAKAQLAQVDAELLPKTTAAQAAWENENIALSEKQRLTTELAPLQEEHNRLLGERNKLEGQLNVSRDASIDGDKRLAEAHVKVGAAQENYTNLVNNFTRASHSAFSISNMFAGMLGGAMIMGIQGVVSGFEHLIELGSHIFESAIDGATELGEKLVEIGEDYRALNIQVESYSGASGAALTQFQDLAAQGFAQLDVAGKDYGKTISQLGSMLHLGPSEALKDLANNVTELQDRYAGLKATDLGSIFLTFKTPADQLNESLATLLTQAQASGQGLAALVSAMSGDAAATLQTAGFSLGQVAHFVGELEKHNLPARSVMVGLASSMDEITKVGGGDFRTGLTSVVNDLDRLGKLGDTQGADAVAEKFFGGRRWTEVMQMIPALKSLISSMADSFNAPESALHQYLSSTETLDNKIMEFRHHVEDAFKGAGEKAHEFAEHALDEITDWFDKNRENIINDIKGIGDSFLNQLPNIEKFVSASLRIFGGFMDGVDAMGAFVLQTFGGIAEEVGDFLKLSPLTRGLGKDISDAGESMVGMAQGLKHMDIGDGMRHTADWLDKNISKVKEGKEDWDELWDAVSGQNAPPMIDVNVPVPPLIGGIPTAPAPPGALGPGGGTPGGPPAGTSTGETGGDNSLMPSIAPGTTSLGTAGAAYHMPPNYVVNGVNWGAIAQAESGGNFGINHGEGTADNPVSGAFQIGDKTWADFGGLAYGVPRAYMAPPDAQLVVAQRILAAQGPKAWPQTFANHPDWFGSYAGQRAVGAQTGGMPFSTRGFDQGGKTWTDHVIDAAKWFGDDALSFAAMAGKDTLAGLGWAGEFLGKAAGPVGIVTPLITEMISPSAHTSTSDTTPFNPGLRAPGRQGGGLGSLGDPGNDYIKSVIVGSPEWDAMPLHSQNMATYIAMQMGLGGYESGGKGPKDTLPVWVTPKEYIFNEEATDKYGWFIHAANEEAQGRSSGMSTMFRWAKGLQGGGPPAGSSGAMPGGLNTQGAQVDTIAIAKAIEQTFGITNIGMYRSPDRFNEHSSGEAADIMIGGDSKNNPALTQLGNRIAGFALGNAAQFGVQYVLWQQKQWNPDGSSSPMEDRGSDTQNHFDHVHIKTAGGGYPQGGGPGAAGAGSMPAGTSSTPAPAASFMVSFPGASFSGWSGGGGFGASPMGFGSGGSPGGGSFTTPPGFAQVPQYPGETYEQWWSKTKSLTDANQRLNDLTSDLNKKLAQQKTLQDQLNKLNAEDPLLKQGDQDQINSKQQQLDDLNTEIDKIKNHDIPEARGDLQATQDQSAQAPSGGGGKDQYQQNANNAARTFGSQFMGGLAQSLGFPDVFGGKAPWDFGIVKMLGGFATGFYQGMQQNQQQYGSPFPAPGTPSVQGSGYGGGGGQPGTGGSFFQGLSGAAGFNIPGLAMHGGQFAATGGTPSQLPSLNAHLGSVPPTLGSQTQIGSIAYDNSITVHPQNTGELVSSVSSIKNSYRNSTALANTALPVTTL